jgi:hypothetical protein
MDLIGHTSTTDPNTFYICWRETVDMKVCSPLCRNSALEITSQVSPLALNLVMIARETSFTIGPVLGHTLAA